ncbi:SIMPL domain-containing protein [Sphingomonas sp. ST-64]|uniref:SIMPL domain-containing protein n=1 Tax=Sphingomonas plantiphila TaxID=3163295 RepID=A0ABW8YTX7_9SPHN
MVAAATPVGAQERLQPGEVLLEVSAEGSARATPDVLTVSIGVQNDGKTAAEAMAANARQANLLVAVVRSAGIAAKDAKTVDLRVEPRFAPAEGGGVSDAIIGYRSTNKLELILRNLSRAPDLIDALFKAGATDLDKIKLDFADRRELEGRARANAVAQAKLQAEQYAAALGQKVVRIVRVSERSAYGGGGSGMYLTGTQTLENLISTLPQVIPGEQALTVTVWIDFAIAPK